jgi:hypothetical protein
VLDQNRLIFAKPLPLNVSQKLKCHEIRIFNNIINFLLPVYEFSILVTNKSIKFG